MENLERNNIQISSVLPEDAQGVREVQYKSWLATYPNEQFGITVGDIEDRYRDSFTDESIRKRQEQYRNLPAYQQILVAKENDIIVGFCIVEKMEDRNQLRAIYMRPDMAGRGIGSKLWQESLKFFDPTKDTYVEVADYNVRAIGFYRKLGFEDTGRRWSDSKFKMKSGAMIPEMEMVRKSTKNS